MNTKKEHNLDSLAMKIDEFTNNSTHKAGVHLINTVLVINKLVDQVLSRFNLNGPRIRVLFLLVMNGGTMKARDLAKPLLLTRQGSSKIIYSLVKNGLVSKRADTTDRRSFNISITRKGQDVTDACLPILKWLSDMTMGEIDESDLKILEKLTKKIYKSAYKELI